MKTRRLTRSLIAGAVASAAVAVSIIVITTATAATTRFEAESATISQGAVNSDHAGFTGSGFVNYDNVAGSFVEFAVPSSAARTVTLSFRYANGVASGRPMDVTINGTLVSNDLPFDTTGSWTTWRTQSVTAALGAGTNTIRATATAAAGGPNLDSLTVDDGTVPTTDWSVAMVDSTMARFTPSTFGGWSYTNGLYLWGQYLVFKRTGNPAYLSYIRSWADRFVHSDGSIDQSFNSLDSMQSGNVLIALFRETGQAKYRTAANKIRTRLNTYPRTRDGGWWHANNDSRRNQLWGDGVFMVLPFLARYGTTFGDSDGFASRETARQLEVYFSHLRDNQTSLLRHAYNQDKDTSWADPVTGQSPMSWCRAMGWFGMATIEVLEFLPATHPRRQALIDILKFLAVGWEANQDKASGRWFQVVNMGDRSDNWTETSCSSMYTYVLSRAVERSYIDAHYRDVAAKGWRGVLARISKGSDGRTNLTEICVGTNVGSNYAFYRDRPRATNDRHGLGAFLIMNEQMLRVGA
jgi:unsaturated rhamnogalacturonyl hydrolase